jgi:hypothetical protein
MTNPRRQRRTENTQVIEHASDDDNVLQDPEEFLDRANPENDGYMKAIEHVQRKIMHASSMLRPKQVNTIKSVFSGQSYTEAGANNQCHPQTVSKLVHSTLGQRLLTLLQYHLKLLEGPNEALRRNLLWRIAADNEEKAPKTSIQAISELNKMHYQNQQLQNPDAGGAQIAPQITINIDQRILPKGVLDRG